MAKINYSFPLQAGYNGNYTVKAFTVANPGLEVVSFNEVPPHTNPVVGQLTVPTYEPHIIKVFGCGGKQIAQFVAEPPNDNCPAMPGVPAMSLITGTTATATWAAAPVPPDDGYDWEIYSVIGFTENLVDSGNTATLSENLTGLTAGTRYRFAVRGKCNGEMSSAAASVYFTTAAGASTEGTVTLDVPAGGGGTVTIKSTTNQNEYTIIADDTTGSIKVPYDEYEIIEVVTSCGLEEEIESDPALNTTFTLNGGTPTKTITIGCV